jgi:ankyrin repeat protein
MVRLLLSRGAISSQAENNGMTAFHSFVESGKMDMVETLFDQDQAGVRSAINHLVFSGYRWNAEVVAPLHTAIEHGDPLLILRLLEAGSKAHIDYETWLKAAKVSPMHSSMLEKRDLETNKQNWREMEQPLLQAIHLGQVEVAIELLEAGADPSQLTPRSFSLLQNEYQRRYNKGETALDLVESAIKGLKKNKNSGSPTALKKVEKRPGLDDYLERNNFQPGTYSQWFVAKDVRDEQKRFEVSLKNYEKTKAQREGRDQVEEKKRQDALSELISDFEKLREALIARGGKTFAEIYPKIKTDEHNNRYYSSGSNSSETEVKPYEHSYNFYYDSSMTDSRRDGYVKL